MELLHLTNESFEQEVLKCDKPVLVDFFATWCGPCRAMTPVLEHIAGQHPEYKICKVDIDACEELAVKYRVMAVPTMIVFSNGQVSGSVVGARSEETILELLEQA